MNKKLSLSEALDRLKSGKSVSAEEVDHAAQRVTVKDAILLNRHGIYVEEGQIIYDDDEVAYDPEFDDHEWGTPQPANTVLHVELTVPVSVKAWLEAKKINVNDLISNLLVGQMVSDEIINHN